MIIKNYYSPVIAVGIPVAFDIQIIEDVTSVVVKANYFPPSTIGENVGCGEGPTSIYGSENKPSTKGGMIRHIDFTKDGVRSRLIVTEHAYICNDRGQTIEKVSA